MEGALRESEEGGRVGRREGENDVEGKGTE